MFEGAPLKSSHTSDYSRSPGMEKNGFMEFEDRHDLQAKQQGEI